MNRFKNLDNIFPCGKDRRFGEVVSVFITCVYEGKVVTSYSWKRKAWYVNASVNAFHMHRGLCREFSNENKWLSDSRTRVVKRAFGDIVNKAYVWNSESDQQYHSFALDLKDGFWAPMSYMAKDSDAVEVLQQLRLWMLDHGLTMDEYCEPVSLPSSD